MNSNSHKDKAVSWILAATWFGTITAVVLIRDDVPVYLLVLGTIFFLILVPSMREMVRSFEKYFARASNKDSSARDG